MATGANMYFYVCISISVYMSLCVYRCTYIFVYVCYMCNSKNHVICVKPSVNLMPCCL